MIYKNIELSFDAEIAIITLARPEAMNALCSELNTEMLDALELIKHRDDIRVLIITGGPKVFAAGADVKEMLTASPGAAEAMAEVGGRINNSIESLSIPVIAAINGAAIGGGLELALACDFRICGENSVFALPETGLGVIPGAGGTQRLIPLVGITLTREIVMLGRKLKGIEAAEVGLVNKVTGDENVPEEAKRFAQQLIRVPAISLKLAKRAINAGMNGTLAEGKRTEQAAFAMSFAAPDQNEGMSSLLEKRAPVFKHSW